MFESAELGAALSKQDYDARVPALRVGLINAQHELDDTAFATRLERVRRFE